MPILNPNTFKVYVPDIENVDQTAEPTLEGPTGTDFIGNAVAAGGQAINALDGYPNRPLTVATAGAPANDPWHLAYALTKRRPYDAWIIDGHNLLSAYPNALRSQVEVIHHTSDVIGSGTRPEPTLLLTGLLNRRRPYLDFDGVDDKVETGTDTNLGYDDTTPFSLESWFRTSEDENNRIIIGLWRSASATNNDIIALQHNKGAILLYMIEVWSGSHIAITTDTDTFDDGEWHHVVATFDGTSLNTGMEIYVDGTLQAVTRSGNGTVTGFAATDALAMANNGKWQNSNYFLGQQNLGRLWNRELSSSEATNLYNGDLVPVADQWGSQTALNVSNCVNGGGANAYDTFDGISATGFHAIETAGAARAGTADEIAFVSSVKYGISFTATLTSGEAPNVMLAPGDTGALIQDEGEFTATAGANYFEATCNSTETGLVRFINTIATEYTIADLKITRLGCVAEYNHDGISKQQGKLYDGGTNNLHGTVTGAEFVDAPDNDNPSFYLEEFAEVGMTNLFWYNRINQIAETEVTGPKIGLSAPCKKYEFNIKAEGGFGVVPGYPGVALQRTQAGRTQAEEFYGREDAFDIGLQIMTEADWETFQEFLDRVKGALLPFYVVFNDGDSKATESRIVRRMRLESVAVKENYGTTRPWDVTLSLRDDL